MKLRFLILIIFTILFGFLISKMTSSFFFNDSSKKYNCYLLILDGDKINKDSYYIIDSDSSTVFYGITTKNENANKLKDVYSKMGIKVNVEKSFISNEEFVDNLEQYDLLLSTTLNDSDLISINKVILSTYEDLVLNS